MTLLASITTGRGLRKYVQNTKVTDAKAHLLFFHQYGKKQRQGLEVGGAAVGQWVGGLAASEYRLGNRVNLFRKDHSCQLSDNAIVVSFPQKVTYDSNPAWLKISQSILIR